MPYIQMDAETLAADGHNTPVTPTGTTAASVPPADAYKPQNCRRGLTPALSPEPAIL